MISEIDMTPAEMIEALRKELAAAQADWHKEYTRRKHWEKTAEAALAVIKHLQNP